MLFTKWSSKDDHFGPDIRASVALDINNDTNVRTKQTTFYI